METSRASRRALPTDPATRAAGSRAFPGSSSSADASSPSSGAAGLMRIQLVTSWALVGTLMILGLAPSNSQGQPQPHALIRPEGDFRLEWEQRQAQRGPLIAGYVHNNGGTTAGKVSVLVEGLDGAGRVVNATIGYVTGTVPAFNRAYFEVRVPDAASYRVSVSSFEWIKGGGGGGM
jgi:hypothetical protein